LGEILLKWVVYGNGARKKTVECIVEYMEFKKALVRRPHVVS
jgi:hypothetical protein